MYESKADLCMLFISLILATVLVTTAGTDGKPTQSSSLMRKQSKMSLVG